MGTKCVRCANEVSTPPEHKGHGGYDWCAYYKQGIWLIGNKYYAPKGHRAFSEDPLGCPGFILDDAFRMPHKPEVNAPTRDGVKATLNPQSQNPPGRDIDPLRNMSATPKTRNEILEKMFQFGLPKHKQEERDCLGRERIELLARGRMLKSLLEDEVTLKGLEKDLGALPNGYKPDPSRLERLILSTEQKIAAIDKNIDDIYHKDDDIPDWLK